MEMTVGQIAEFLETWAPLSYGESYDNPGLIVGRSDQTVETVLVAVDASESVIRQALALKANLVITHHPLIFFPIKKLTDSDRTGRRLLTLAENRIALYSAHTNLDTAPDGNNDRAARLLGLESVEAVAQEGGQPCLRVGQLPEAVSLKMLAQRVKERFRLPSVRLIGSWEQKVQTVALCTGSGMDFMPLAIQQGADALITGDITYHKADDAAAAGLGLIDATHFGTDRLSVGWVAEELQNFAKKRGCLLRVIQAQEEDLYTLV